MTQDIPVMYTNLNKCSGVASPFISEKQIHYKLCKCGQHIWLAEYVEPMINDKGVVSFECLRCKENHVLHVSNIDSVFYNDNIVSFVDKE